MNKQVKRYADEGNIQRLRYIFYDSFEVDPTFEKYQEDYEYCKNILGFFEEYKELTALDNSRLGEDYWFCLKRDLKNNFAQKRFEFMETVAPIIFAEKVARLKDERMAANQVETNSGNDQNNDAVVRKPEPTRVPEKNIDVDALQLALDKKAAEKIADEKAKEAERQRLKEKEYNEQLIRQAEVEAGKKEKGIALEGTKWMIIIAVVLIVIVILVLIK